MLGKVRGIKKHEHVTHKNIAHEGVMKNLSRMIFKHKYVNVKR